MEQLFKELNIYLADLNVLRRKVQNYHWNLSGRRFYVIHLKLDEFYEELDDQIDNIAEKTIMLEGQPLATMKDYLEITNIVEAKNEEVTIEYVLEHIIKDFQHMLASVTKMKKHADEIDCYLISAYMDETIAYYSKAIWMLKKTQG